MEYQPLCRKRDEIRVISIQPSHAYSGGRKGDSWASWKDREGVRIDLADELIQCVIENVSLQATNDRYRTRDRLRQLN